MQETEKTPNAKRRVGWNDWLMVFLAILSLVILIVESAFGRGIDPAHRRILFIADLAIVGIFILEFSIRLGRAQRKWHFVLSHWYDVIGMIPVGHPMFRSFRLLRILRIVVITSRFVRATNRTFGEMTVEALASRYRDALVGAIGNQIILQSLDFIEPPLVRTRLPSIVGATLASRKEDLSAAVRESIQGRPIMRKLVRLPWSNEILGALEDVSLEVVVGVLESDEINSTVQQAVASALDEIRRSVREIA